MQGAIFMISQLIMFVFVNLLQNNEIPIASGALWLWLDLVLLYWYDFKQWYSFTKILLFFAKNIILNILSKIKIRVPAEKLKFEKGSQQNKSLGALI